MPPCEGRFCAGGLRIIEPDPEAVFLEGVDYGYEKM